MGNGLSLAVRKLVEDRKLLKTRPDHKLVEKELAAARADLKDARDSLKFKKSKWATIQGYYSMFHSARALLFAKGFREKTHHALLVGIQELYVNDIERSLVQEFEHSMYLRQEADYGLKFSEGGARDVIETAEKLLSVARILLRGK